MWSLSCRPLGQGDCVDESDRLRQMEGLNEDRLASPFFGIGSPWTSRDMDWGMLIISICTVAGSGLAVETFIDGRRMIPGILRIPFHRAALIHPTRLDDRQSLLWSSSNFFYAKPLPIHLPSYIQGSWQDGYITVVPSFRLDP